MAFCGAQVRFVSDKLSSDPFPSGLTIPIAGSELAKVGMPGGLWEKNIWIQSLVPGFSVFSSFCLLYLLVWCGSCMFGLFGGSFRSSGRLLTTWCPRDGCEFLGIMISHMFTRNTISLNTGPVSPTFTFGNLEAIPNLDCGGWTTICQIRVISLLCVIWLMWLIPFLFKNGCFIWAFWGNAKKVLAVQSAEWEIFAWRPL